jgi:hypothetical protein
MALRDALGAQIVAGARLIGAERAHVQVAGDVGFDAARYHFARELGVSKLETTSGKSFFIEDADEVDDHIAAGDHGTQGLGLMHIHA